MVEEAESQVGEEEETQEDEDQLNDTVWSQTGHNSVHCVSQDTDHTRDTLSHTSHAVWYQIHWYHWYHFSHSWNIQSELIDQIHVINS